MCPFCNCGSRASEFINHAESRSKHWEVLGDYPIRWMMLSHGPWAEVLYKEICEIGNSHHDQLADPMLRVNCLYYKESINYAVLILA